jgi:hypothetical protein
MAHSSSHRRTQLLAAHLLAPPPLQAGAASAASLDPLVTNPWPEQSMAPREPATPTWHTFGPASHIVASSPVRLGDVVDGHVHPSLCVTQSGAVLAVYNIEGGGAAVLMICRSEDGGATWSAPAPIPASAARSKRGVYPGSLSVLRSGRIVLQWAPYYERGEPQHGDPAQFTLAEGIETGDVYRVPEYLLRPTFVRFETQRKIEPHSSAWVSQQHCKQSPTGLHAEIRTSVY